MNVNNASTLIEILSDRCRSVPDNLIYSFYSHPSHISLSYRSLAAQMLGIASELEKYIAQGSRVILLYPSGLDFISALFACFYAKMIAVPVYSHNMNIEKLMPRLVSVLQDTEATVILTTTAIVKDRQKLIELAPSLQNVTFIYTDEMNITQNNILQPIEIDPQSIAFLQYSSGSTGSPKGVMVTHSNLMSNLRMIHKAFGLIANQNVVSWLPHYHDMGLIGNILGSIYSETPLHFFSPIEFVRRPLRWLELISSTQATVSGGPNFAYELCNRHIKPHHCEHLDLSAWEVAYNGAEVVRESTMNRFKTLFAPYGFKAKSLHPCYGLAEATLMVASSEKSENHREMIVDSKMLSIGIAKKVNESNTSLSLVSSGRIQEGQRVFIIDPNTRQICVTGGVGEIWVHGPSICKGYWNKPSETEFTFSAHIPGQSETFLRTGDMGFFDDKGWLYVTGRLKELIIIRGQNHSPEDIENTVMETHPLLHHSCVVAFSQEMNGQEYLVVLVAYAKNMSGHEEYLINLVKNKVAQRHDLSIKEFHFIKRGVIPLTSSGKIKRSECKRLYVEGAIRFIEPIQEPQSEHEAIMPRSAQQLSDARFATILSSLQKMWAQELLVPLEEINIVAPLNIQSMDSLSKVRIQYGIQELVGQELDPTLILNQSNLIDLARMITDAASFAPELPSPNALALNKLQHYPLSQGQQSLFFLNKLSSDNAAYIISRAVSVKSTLDISALDLAFKNLINRHCALRTRFIEIEGKPMQVVLSADQYEATTNIIEITSKSMLDEELKIHANRSFDLSDGILARLTVFKTEQEPVLLFSVHHIVSDLIALTCLITELCELYSSIINGQPPKLVDISTHPAEYVHYEEQWLVSDKAEHMRQFWRQTLSFDDEPIDLPTDNYRPATKTYKGSTCSFTFSHALTQKIQQFAMNKGVTNYVVLLSAYLILLHRYTGKEQVIVGSPMANRLNRKFANLVSYLVNPIPLRADFSQSVSFNDLITQMQKKTLDASLNQQYPLAKIIEDLKIQRDASITPLFQVMFSYLNPMLDNDLVAFALGQAQHVLRYKQLTLEPYPIEHTGSQFDLNVAMGVVNNAIVSAWEYSTDLFELSTIQRMQCHYQLILEYLIDNPHHHIDRFPLMTSTEKQQIVFDWNATETAYDLEKPLHVLFEQQVKKTPHKIAVLDNHTTLSYEIFNMRVNQLAHHLIHVGIKPGSIVAVQMYRSVDMLTALYAILKTGAAYLPLDPDYPKAHSDWMLEDAQARMVLTQILPNCEGMPSTDPGITVNPEQIAYIIYTSGSTGKPKGVKIPHRGICNRLLWMQDAYPLTEMDRVLQKTPYTFDVSVWELFWPLISGASVYISDPDGHKDPYYLATIIQTQHITTLHFVPSMFRPFLENQNVNACTSLKRIFCSGEALSPALVELCHQHLDVELHNLYGPTEASVDVSAWQCPIGQKIDRILIGKPIANTQLYILDKFMQPVPVGIHGELFIGGICLADGYLNRQELTKERFITNPFFPQTKLYKTGDLCRFQIDGNIEYLGRIDNQVKIRGFRIELEEVEAAVSTHPAISEAVAVAMSDALGSSRLGVYFVASSKTMPSVNELRTYLAERLPEHMLPSVYMSLPSLTRLSNGKLDRKSLPKFDSCMSQAVYAAPRTALEQLLCSIYEQLLSINKVSIHDNFFELGGDSIMGLRAVAKIKEAGFELSIQHLYSNASIAEVAVLIEKNNESDDHLKRLPFSLVCPTDFAKLPKNIEDAYPLSKMQEGLVFHSEFSTDYEIYVMGMRVILRLDEQCLSRSLVILTARHPLLRTAFDHLHYSEPLQFVYPSVQVPVKTYDIQHLSSEKQDQEIERFMREEKYHKFDWSKAPFLRIAIHKCDEHTQQFTFSHPLFDGWSMGLLITEFFTIYGALLTNQEPPLLPMPQVTYRDFVVLEQNTIRSEASINYWKQQLTDRDRGELPRWPEHRKSRSGMHIRKTVAVSSETLRGLQYLAEIAKVPLKSVLLAAHMRVVGLLTGRTDVMTGLLVNGRPEQISGDQVIGMFLNTVPFSVQLHGRDWVELVKDTFESERDLLPHRRFPLAELVRTYGASKPLFETAFNYIHFHIYKALEKVPDLSVLSWKSPSDQTYFPLTAYFHLDISQASSELLFFLDVDTGVLSPQQIDRLQHYYLNTLNAMASDCNAHYSLIPLLPVEEKELLLKAWNKTEDSIAAQYPFVHQRFSQQAALHPNKIALTFEGIHFTYDVLEKRANRVARFLQALGVKANVPVGIYFKRSFDLIVALLAVLKSGGAYVPLDPVYPKERLAYMLNDSQTPIVLTHDALVDTLPEGPFQILNLDENNTLIDKQSDNPIEIVLNEEDLAYVMYTSGSTGKPKGVEIPHRALGNFMSSMEKVIPWTQDDSLLAVTTISFDIAGLEIYLPLTTGAHLVLASQELAMDGMRLGEELTRSNITTIQATPATWRMLLSVGWKGRLGLKVLCGGERMPQDLAHNLLDRGCHVWNMYGPTETTIWSTVCKVDSADEGIPIGKPIMNTTTLVLDEFGQLAPVGVPGELYIGGRGVAHGYRNLPDLTAERFCVGPIGLMYKTGDRVCLRPNGMLEYLSRMDQQIKVRGFRIELGEIETVLNTIAGITKAATKIVSDEFGENHIIAYLIQNKVVAYSNGELRSIIAEKLPNYMIPSMFVMLDDLPMTLNGKIDYKALPNPVDIRIENKEKYLPPETDLQRKIVKIFADVLRMDRVCIDDNFFDLGGHSLSLVRVHMQLQDLLNTKIPLLKLFEHSTVRKIAALFDKDEEKVTLKQANKRANTRKKWLDKQINRRNIIDTISEPI